MDLMLCGQKATWSSLDQYLSEEARATGRVYSYQIIAVQKGNNTFFKVRFQWEGFEKRGWILAEEISFLEKMLDFAPGLSYNTKSR